MAAVRVLLAFRRLPASGLCLYALKVHDAMAGNSLFPDPPFDLAELKSSAQALEQADIAAQDRGSALIDRRKRLEQGVIGQLRELAAYVQFIAQGNPQIIYAAGFETASQNTSQTPLPRPQLYSIYNPASTQLGLKVKPLRNARVYEVQVHTGDGQWRPQQTFQNTRRMWVTGLVPGTMYWVRVRAIGGSTGQSDWSDTVSHMCI